MRMLAFSDLHRDLDQARELVRMAAEADCVVGVGDFASIHEGLTETLAALTEIAVPAVLVPGNNETDAALRAEAADWPAASVVHGEAVEVGGLEVFGLGGGVPTTPWDWSFDLTEEQAGELLTGLPEGAVLATHSPPKGHADRGFGSEAVLAAIEAKRPRLVICGHIHECWGEQSEADGVPIVNLGPAGRYFDL